MKQEYVEMSGLFLSPDTRFKIIVNFKQSKSKQHARLRYREYTHDVMAAILVFQNNETAAMLVYQTNPVGVQLFSYVNTFFCSSKFAWLLDT